MVELSSFFLVEGKIHSYFFCYCCCYTAALFLMCFSSSSHSLSPSLLIIFSPVSALYLSSLFQFSNFSWLDLSTINYPAGFLTRRLSSFLILLYNLLFSCMPLLLLVIFYFLHSLCFMYSLCIHTHYTTYFLSSFIFFRPFPPDFYEYFFSKDDDRGCLFLHIYWLASLVKYAIQFIRPCSIPCSYYTRK